MFRRLVGHEVVLAIRDRRIANRRSAGGHRRGTSRGVPIRSLCTLERGLRARESGTEEREGDALEATYFAAAAFFCAKWAKRDLRRAAVFLWIR